ncbi:MAG: AAA family ATPase [Spirochaetales bacterium]|uniref:AAA family ATPase n=1 Tax=Candidatus Thalassospirochaeta sargassi TaxID=3119039 RepID=A0AAJ1MJE5_9SPIO|nr:AAA family ATPase [Spirochaetales bacterium]
MSELNVSALTASGLLGGLEKVVKGKRDFLELLTAAVITGGHVLVEDLPGLGKTTAARSLAALIDTSGDRVHGFSRIQFTPDLLPYDITGVDIFHPESGEFRFNPGPIFASIVLADEINRSTPKVQSALLEVMAEGQVTSGGTTRQLGDFFFVIATQNPIEIEGTYSLPIAQLDRFLMRLSIGYPDRDSEFLIVTEDPSVKAVPKLEPVCTVEDILEARAASESVFCDERLIHAVIDAAAATRTMKDVNTGISPRGPLMLIKTARSLALMRDRDYVIDQDLLDLCGPVLCHRLIMSGKNRDADQLVRELIIEKLDKINY